MNDQKNILWTLIDKNLCHHILKFTIEYLWLQKNLKCGCYFQEKPKHLEINPSSQEPSRHSGPKEFNTYSCTILDLTFSYRMIERWLPPAPYCSINNDHLIFIVSFYPAPLQHRFWHFLIFFPRFLCPRTDQSVRGWRRLSYLPVLQELVSPRLVLHWYCYNFPL